MTNHIPPPAAFAFAGDSRDILFEHVLDVVLIVDPTGRITWVAPSVEHALGYQQHDLAGRSLYAVCHPDDAGQVMGLISALLDPSALEMEKHEQRGDLRLLHLDGSWRDMDVRASDFRDHPDVGGVLIVAHDVTRHKRAAVQLQRHALFDPLTGLPNRTLFLTWLDHALARASRGGEPIVVMFLDVDNLNLINIRYGRAAGDRVLTDVAQRLQSSLRASDIAARLSGDEFIVLLEDVADDREASLVASRIIDALREPIEINGELMSITVSIGVTLGRGGSGLPGVDTGTGAGDLLRDADIALSQAKSAGKNRWALL